MKSRESKLNANEETGLVTSGSVHFFLDDGLMGTHQLTIPQVRVLNEVIRKNDLDIRKEEDLGRVIRIANTMAEVNPVLFILDPEHAKLRVASILEFENIQRAWEEKQGNEVTLQ